MCEQLVRVIRPDVAAPVDPAMQPLVRPLYDAVMQRLSAQVRDGALLRARCGQEVGCQPSPPRALLPAPPHLPTPVFPALPAPLQCVTPQDQDQEVKECATSCMATAVASLGDVLGADVAQVRPGGRQVVVREVL